MFARTYQSGEGPFTPEELDAFANLAQSKIHPTPRSVIMGKGDRTDFCLYIESGLVKVMSEQSSETGSRFAGLRGPGDLVGEKAAILRKPRTASIFALTDVEGLWIPGGLFRDYCRKQNPDIIVKLWAIDDERHTEEVDRSGESSISKEQRFAELLTYLVSKGHREADPEGIAVKSPQKELAEFMNLSRESVSAIVRRFKEEHIIKVIRGKTVIANWDRLEMVANGHTTITP